MEMLLQGQRAYFMVNENNFPFDLIFLAHPNTHIYGKAFPEVIWSQNKHSLNGLVFVPAKNEDEKNTKVTVKYVWYRPMSRGEVGQVSSPASQLPLT